MRSVGLKVLKNKLSEYVRLAASGETVLVTDRNRVVAELVPPQPGHGRHVADANYAELIRKGIITPAKIVGKGPPPRMSSDMTLEEILERPRRGARRP